VRDLRQQHSRSLLLLVAPTVPSHARGICTSSVVVKSNTGTAAPASATAGCESQHEGRTAFRFGLLLVERDAVYEVLVPKAKEPDTGKLKELVATNPGQASSRQHVSGCPPVVAESRFGGFVRAQDARARFGPADPDRTGEPALQEGQPLVKDTSPTIPATGLPARTPEKPRSIDGSRFLREVPNASESP
jgi:hypothetical protein